MISRRSLLKAAAVTAVGIPAATLGIKVTRASAAGLTLSIVNNTGRYPNTAIWAYIVGTNLSTGEQAYVRADGTLTAVSAALNGADGFADLGIPLAASGTTGLALPPMSGRVYFSIQDKLKFKVVTDGAGRAALQYPAGWVASDPSYSILHDCIEFTLNDAGMFCNTTNVDMLSIPMAITLDGAASQTTGTMRPGGRTAVFSTLAALPDFTRLVIDDLRVIAPGHGLDSGLFAATYFASYVDQVWAKYAGTDLTVQTDSRIVTGRVSGDVLAFTGDVASIRKPTTRDVLYCDGALAAPNDGITGPVAAVLGAGFNRSTLLDSTTQPVTNPASFYQNPITNHYSRVIHENTVDGKAYGFAFDDVCSLASYVQDSAPRSITVTLTPFD